MAYNGEIAVSTALKLGVEGAVDAAPLLALLNKLPDDDLDIEAVEGEFRLKGRKKESGIRMQAEILLPIETVEEAAKWRKLPEAFVEAVDIVQQCAHKNDSNGFHLMCIHVHPEYIEACDNFQFTRFPLATGLKQPTLVKRDALVHITGLNVTEICRTSTWLHFRNPDGLKLSCRRYLDEYPNLSPYLEKTGSKVQLPSGLAEAIERAEIASKDNPDENHIRVKLEKIGRLTIRGEGALAWHKEGPRKVKYSGPDIEFMIAPQLFSEVVKRNAICEVSENLLKVDGGRFTFATMLIKPGE